ncbi:hypothetical protein BBBOND_0302630 [Babesia bigemina]|uniref:6-Cys domain-containing protein n=1 Tax=Babesia bigemina TaxID=5866 RepID=A0A061DBV3_BABBI|nr:hypothetical protein BBBOND_0302630 [Babesia bigemina]CDR96359.1 hypothetical protein BBBOND_0302630 [Babesia bigemina]|eukprot:XP_012768545.1 hypothetical protein BBBOND_0302630 [Babesia bigemina]
MGTYRVARHVLIFCSINLYLMRPIVAVFCDFGDPHGLLSNNALARCYMDIDNIASVILICPRRINDADYILHPQPTADDRSIVNTYASDYGEFRSVPLSDVIKTESGSNLVWFGSKESQTELHFNFPIHELFAITKRYLVFICGPRDLVLSDALKRHLVRINSSRFFEKFPWTPAEPLTNEIYQIGSGLGVLVLYRGQMHVPFQGCGSRPSTLFAPDEVTVDPVTGTRSCSATPMSKSPIGFVCEDQIQPENCMRFLLDKDGSVVITPEPYPYWDIKNHGPWVVARYFDDLALPPFHGECRCINSETGRLKAKIEILSETEHVCDITSKIFRNRLRPISGPWCAVVLHPGSTLTIRFPIPLVEPAFMYEDSPDVPFSQLPSAYEYETEFLPNNLATMRQLKSIHDIDDYDEVGYNETIAGDALELDVSQMSRGEVKLKYHLDKPLALRTGLNSFVYHWTLKSRNMYVSDQIRAIVEVTFAFNHEYTKLGCDRYQRQAFDQRLSRNYCATKRMGNGIGDVYECSLHLWRDAWRAGIYCRSDEKLLPANCKSKGYYLYSNNIIRFPVSVRSALPYPIRGFQVFNFDFRHDIPVSYACMCVDSRGYETAKLVLEHIHEETHTYKVRREGASNMLFSYVSFPWHKTTLLLEGTEYTYMIVLRSISKKSIKLDVGTRLSITCGLDPYDHTIASNGNVTTTWLPSMPNEFHYIVAHTSQGRKLIAKLHGDAIAATPAGFEVVDNDLPAHQELTITSHRSAILVSKDPLHKKYVPMRFVCGKTLNSSDLSIVTGNASGIPIRRITEASSRYTWNIVKVKVETTDPYMQGCGVTYESTELFKPETPKLYDADGEPQFGCKIDIQAAGEAAFYCPAPYVLDPPECFYQVSVNGEVKNLVNISQSLVASHSNHFVILRFDGELIGPVETLLQTPPLECRCVTIKGIVLSTIHIKNYYAK